MSGESSPPRFADRILRRVLPSGSAGRSILGDLHEEFYERSDTSAPWARLWYIATATRIGLRYMAVRRTERRDERHRSPGDFMHDIWKDTQFAIRRLISQPAFTVTAIAIIGLGIGANTAIYSIVNAVLFRPLPYSEPDRLIRIFTNARNSDEPSAVSYPDFLDYSNLTSHLRAAAAVEAMLLSLGTESGAEAVMVETHSANFFSITGIEPTLGRTFLPEEDEPGAAEPVAIVSYNAWERRYGRNPDILGTTVRLNDRPVTIVGVGPDDFSGTFVGITMDFWVPLGTAAVLEPDRVTRMEMRGARGLFVYARLQDNATLEQTGVVLNRLAATLGEEHPDTNAERTVSVFPANQVRLHPVIDVFLYPVAALLLALVAIVLLVAVTNLANLLLVRATANRKDVAVRIALGSSRWRIISQLLTESTLIGVLGGATGLLIAVIASRAIVSYQPPLPVPVAIDLSLDQSVLMYTLVLSVLTGILFGLVPALRGSRPDLVNALKDNAHGVNLGGRRFGIRNVLVVTQIVLSGILLVSAGLFIRSLRKAHDVDPGFVTSGIALATFDVSRGAGNSSENGRAFLEQYRERVLGVPGVTSVALAERLPLGLGLSTMSARAANTAAPPDGNLPEVDFLVVGHHFFETMQVPLIRGRGFEPADTPDSPGVAIISEALALRFWNSIDVTGNQIVLGASDDDPSLTVIGVTRDIKVRTLGEPPRPLIYRPVSQDYREIMTVLAATDGNVPELVRSMRNELRSLDPDVPMLEAKTIDEHFAVTLFGPRMGATLISLFGVLAIALAAVGLYGVIAVSVAQRTREVGVRVALGATPSDVLGLVMRQGLTLAGVGLAIGLFVSAVVTQGLSGFLIDVPALDPLTYLTVAATMLGVAGAASYLPARRAASIDPQTALRYE